MGTLVRFVGGPAHGRVDSLAYLLAEAPWEAPPEVIRLDWVEAGRADSAEVVGYYVYDHPRGFDELVYRWDAEEVVDA